MAVSKESLALGNPTSSGEPFFLLSLFFFFSSSFLANISGSIDDAAHNECGLADVLGEHGAVEAGLVCVDHGGQRGRRKKPRESKVKKRTLTSSCVQKL
jgi:hypothetical protein